MGDDKSNKLTLLNKYQSLLIENDRLKTENKKLKEKLEALNHSEKIISEAKRPVIIKNDKVKPLLDIQTKPLSKIYGTAINKNSTPDQKIKLFISLFKGREDVYAKRWQNKNGKSGYAPACSNEWKPGICNKPKIKCSGCSNNAFEPLNEKVIEEHLKGNIVAGIYPMLIDETCFFLAIDFDGEDLPAGTKAQAGWEKDISILRNVCMEFDIPFAVERSRSGKGAHVWYFFDEQIPAALARKFGSALLTFAMSKRHDIKFKSYDRFFPNQDTMPKGGLGNLIALPIQREARKNANSIFVDEQFKPYPDQWEFLSSIKKISGKEVERLSAKLSSWTNGDGLGILRKDDEENFTNASQWNKPWERVPAIRLTGNDFPDKINLVKANMIYIPKEGISQKALNILKRFAAFKNPEFYKAQAMRMPTYNKPRIISCSDETAEYLCLPRGCEDNIKILLTKLDVEVEIVDKTNHGRNIHVEFNGLLKNEQLDAVTELLKYNNGVLAAATAFGKTIVAAKLIADRKTNTLIIVHRKQLLSQWMEQLLKFLNIKSGSGQPSAEEELLTQSNKRGRKRKQYLVGQIGGGKNKLTGIIDIAIMQSLKRKNDNSNLSGEVLYECNPRSAEPYVTSGECVRNYGMVIVDECHHIPAFSFEQVLKNTDAKYVYGLTATPVRLDGHHPIIFMHCGPVRFKVDTKSQVKQRPFEHYVLPRFTSFGKSIHSEKIPIDKESKSHEKQFTTRLPGRQVQEIYSELSVDEMRNQLIVDDIIKNYNKRRNSLILTERTAHVELLAKMISEKIPDVITLTGKIGIRKTREAFKKISETPPGVPLTLVATGKYIGEGFDEPRLDTLFLAMPVSWKGTLQQYVGRLHRLHENKTEVQVYDYVDVHVRMLEKMYGKRLNGYASFGYKTKGETVPNESANFIFNKNSFFPVYINDIINSRKKIFIISPFITVRRVEQLRQYLDKVLNNNIKITIITRPPEDLKEKDRLFLQRTLDSLKNEGIHLLFKSNIHQKFAIIDERIVWYGSINLLAFGNSEESIMRLESSNIANELTRSI